MPFNISDRISTSNFEATDEGFLVFPKAKIARSGIQEYFAFELGLEDRDPLDVVKVYRPPEEVFSQVSMDSFSNKVVTNNHPPEMINADNVKKFQVGYSGDSVSKVGIFLQAKLVITDAETIKDIKDGKSEISNGYVSEMEFTSGVTPAGEQYDAIQSGIKGNHIAIVDKARCGPSCRVTDSKQPRKKEMPKLTIESVDYEASEQLVQAVGNMQTKHQQTLDSKQGEVDAKQSEVDTAKQELNDAKSNHQKELDTLQAKLDDAEKNKITPQTLDSLIEKRSAVIMVASKVIKNFDHAGKDCEQIRKEVVAHEVGDSLNLDEKSVEYIQARFDAIAANVEDGKSTTLADALRQHAEGKDDDEKKDSRDNFVTNTRDAWKFGSKAK